MKFNNILLTRFISLFLFSALVSFISAPASPAAIRTVTGTVTKIVDGDTIHIVTPEQTILKVRLYGITLLKQTRSITKQVRSVNSVNLMVKNQ